MPSSIIAIKAEIVRLLGTCASIATVEDTPASPEEWLNGYRDALGVRSPACHVAYAKEQKIETNHTCGDWQDSTNFTLTILYASNEFDADYAVTLRDEILDTLCSEANQDLGGLASLVNATGWQVLEQDGQAYTVFNISLSVTHEWARA